MQTTLTPADERRLRHLARQGLGVARLARLYGLSEPQVRDLLEEMRQRAAAAPTWWGYDGWQFAGPDGRDRRDRRRDEAIARDAERDGGRA